VLADSIKSTPSDDSVVIGTNKSYAKFVHNGTMDFRHDGPWSEAEGNELLAWKSAQARRGSSTKVVPPKGLMPRPFLVFGLVRAKPLLRRIYGTPMVGRG
jgi:phage gpG-like protein